MDESGPNGLVTVQSRVNRAIAGALRDRDLSGYEIWKWLGAEKGAYGLLAEADLYPTLYRLEAERFLRGDWHEGERTRRTYRSTSTALERAGENGRPALADRANRRSDRPTSPDPESGSWFMSPDAEPAAPSAAKQRSQDDGGDPERAAIGRFTDDLGAALDLPRVERMRVRHEIADHLADSVSALVLSGLEAGEATTEAIDHLGGARDLATRIERAVQTPDRRHRAVGRAAIELVGEIVLWLALSLAVLTVTPGIADLVTALGRLAGLHLIVLRTAEWATNQVAIMLSVGAFAAGRLSIGHLARIGRHRDATLRKPWALGGAAAVLVVALLLPGYQDPLVVATLLAAPVAFVAGTFRPQHVNESSYNLGGIAAAVMVVAAITFVPAGRTFAFDPNGTPGTPLAAGVAPGELTVNQLSDGTFAYALGSAGAETYTVELWPASREGPFIVVDGSVSGPAVVVKGSVDLAKLPPNEQWWVVAVATGSKGERTALAVVIQTGVSTDPGNALGWLLERL